MEDYTRLWIRINWYVKGFPMRMFQWTPDFNPNKESPIYPVWVHFDGLPLYMFSDEALFSIANTIGSPLRIDQNNVKRVKLGTASVCVANNVKRVKLGTASVCVALDVSKPKLTKVCVTFEEENSEDVVEEFWQEVTYDHHLDYYSGCHHLGHVKEECKRKAKGPLPQKKQYKPKAKTTKEWVQTVFGGSKVADGKDNSNPFQALATVEEERVSIGENQQPAERRNNILDASALPPPSLLSESKLQAVTYKEDMEGIAIPPRPKSAPPSLKKLEDDQGDIQVADHASNEVRNEEEGILMDIQDSFEKEGGTPSYG
ncbi:hypothetical protein LIER_24751 [Lithospermum erythrorhizon]|uniref:DUF4283 domain-containing protein n=1 Tax=Lithospermum erythrorhizon TaxID=34254 RepID=A0AAV3R5M0_LITER